MHMISAVEVTNVLLIEPVWNRNYSKDKEGIVRINAFNRTSMESKQ